MTEYVKKQISNITLENLRDNLEVFALVCIFVFSTTAITGS